MRAVIQALLPTTKSNTDMGTLLSLFLMDAVELKQFFSRYYSKAAPYKEEGIFVVVVWFSCWFILEL